MTKTPPKRPAYLRIRQAIIAACLKMNAVGLNQGTSGNISVRVSGGFLITPSGADYERMKPSDIVALDDDGDVRDGGRPSSEWRLHRDIYRMRPEAGAVVHAHSPHATALSCLREGIPPFHYMVAVAGGSDIRCADYATFGTQAISEKMIEALESRRACLLANHGIVAFGKSLESAFALAVEVETLARQYALARTLGDPVLLSEVEMAEVLERFKSYGAAATGG